MSGLQHLSCGSSGLRAGLQKETCYQVPKTLYAKALLQSRDMLDGMAGGNVKEK